MVGLAHPELVGGARREGQLAGGRGRAFDGQLEVGDRAVDRVVLGALGVGVDPADEVLARGGDAAADDDVLAGEDEGAARRPTPSTEAERILPKPPSRCASPSRTSIPEGTQGLVQGPSLIRAAPASK